MSEGDDGGSKFWTGLLIGFILGVLVCLGVGGSVLVVRTQQERDRALDAERAARAAAAAVEARLEAELKDRAAEDARKRNEQQRKQAEAARKAKAAAEGKGEP